MKYSLSLFLSSILFFSCSEKKEVTTTKDPLLEIDNAFLDVSNSTDKQDSLTHFEYQNLTAWGGLNVWYKNSEIIKIVATQRPELGFTETTHFYEDGSNYKSIVIRHLANWDDFFEKYGEIDAVGDDRMTYANDTAETVAHYSVLDSFDLKMIQEASELFIFVSNENKLVP